MGSGCLVKGIQSGGVSSVILLWCWFSRLDQLVTDLDKCVVIFMVNAPYLFSYDIYLTLDGLGRFMIL